MLAILSPATFSFPFRTITGGPRHVATRATSNQTCTTPLRDVTPGSLCAPHGSPENPVTRVVAAHMLMENKAVLIQDPKLTLRDATTTVLNISLPPLNPFASTRAWQDEDNDKAPTRPLINTCGWDPEHQNGLHLPLLRPTLV